MHEGNAVSFRSDARDLVDQANACGPTSGECAVEICRREAHVVDSGASTVDKSSDRGVRGRRFEQLDKGSAGSQASDVGAVGVVERDYGQSEDVAIEGQGGG
jgi:hypothetical protein